MNYIQRFAVISISGVALLALASLAPVFAFAEDNQVGKSEQVAISINDLGNVSVRGAKVAGIAGNVITATTVAGPSTLSWTVTTDSSTKFSISGPATSTSIAQIAVGDTVSFSGVLSGAGLNVKASVVKDSTRVANVNSRSISGIVQSMNATSTSLVLRSGEDNGKGNDNKKTTTIQFTASTAITLNGTTTTFAAIHVGDKVKATGTLNAGGTVLSATSVTVTQPRAAVKDDDDDDFGSKFRGWLSRFGLGDKGGKGKN
ncbi:MAG: DUF5666 domain-containing protein [bacterium]|nr:DUF5666 domain-containing protein [bacterium]